jgi:hypothetical protein
MASSTPPQLTDTGTDADADAQGPGSTSQKGTGTVSVRSGGKAWPTGINRPHQQFSTSTSNHQHHSNYQYQPSAADAPVSAALDHPWAMA